MDISPSFAVTAFQVKWFVILYITTFIPCWISLFLAVRAILKRQLYLFAAWSLLLIILLFLPYGFALATSSLKIWQLWALVILVTLFSYYRIFFSKKELSVDWFWDWYAKSYDTLLVFGPYKQLIRELGSQIASQASNRIRVLEIGCGTGNIAFQLLDNDNIDYLGLDSSEEMIKNARKKNLKNPRFEFEKNNVEKELHLINTQFDVVIVNNVLYALRDHETVVALIHKKIKPGGMFIVSEPLRNSSLGFLFKEYLRTEGIKSIIQLILRLPAFIFILVANLMILEIEHIKNKNFFDQNELEQLLVEKKFRISSKKNVYQEQNILLVAIPV